MELVCRLGMAEEVLADMDLEEVANDIMDSGEDYQIVISEWRVHVPELRLDLYEGIYCCYDREAGGFLPDFAVTVIKQESEKEWLYYEQDGFLITLANFLNGKTDLNTLEQMRCIIRIPDIGQSVQE